HYDPASTREVSFGASNVSYGRLGSQPCRDLKLRPVPVRAQTELCWCQAELLQLIAGRLSAHWIHAFDLHSDWGPICHLPWLEAPLEIGLRQSTNRAEWRPLSKVTGRIALPAPTPPDMRVRIRRFQLD